MKSKLTVTLIALALAVVSTAAVTNSASAERYNHRVARYDRAAYWERPDWWRYWQLKRLYHQRQGYVPDYRECFPGACRDNPYY